MKKIKILLMFTIIMIGCSIYGPYPKEDKYKYAVKTIANYNEIVYVLYGVFWKNALVEDPANSVPSSGTICNMFIMNDQLLIAVYDNTNLTYQILDTTSFADITSTSLNKSITWIRRTFCYQRNDGRYNSFGISYSYGKDGIEIEKDTAIDYIINKINKHK